MNMRAMYPHKQSNFAFRLLVILIFSAALSACGGGSSSKKAAPQAVDDVDNVVEEVVEDIKDSDVPVDDDTAESLPIIISKLSFAGNVSDGIALADVGISLLWKGGAAQDVGRSDAKGDFDVEIPENAEYPIVVRVDKGDGTFLYSLLTDESKSIANLNPITSSVAAALLGENLPVDADPQSVDAGDITAEQFDAAGRTLVETLFGAVQQIDFDAFDDEVFAARTAQNAASGGLPDALIDVIAGLDPRLPISDILSSALDSEDPAVDGSLLTDLGFQNLLAGELISQGRSLTAARELLSAASGGDVPDNINAFVSAFDGVRAQGEALGLEGANLEALVKAAANTTVHPLRAGIAQDSEAIASFINNATAIAGPALAGIAADPDNADIATRGEMRLLLRSLSDDVSGLMARSGRNFTEDLDAQDVTELSRRVRNYANTVAAPLAEGLRSIDAGALSDARLSLVLDKLSEEVGDEVDNFIADLDAETVPAAVRSSARNLAAPLLDSLLIVLNDEALAATDIRTLDEVVESVSEVSAQQLRRLELTEETLDLGETSNLVQNLARAAADFAQNAGALTEGLSKRSEAAVLGATLSQTLGSLVELGSEGGIDLTAADLSVEALQLAQNISQLLGPALSESIAEVSARTGQDLDALLDSAASDARQSIWDSRSELTADVDLQDLQAVVRQQAVESTNALEETFKQIEAAGIRLSDITDTFDTAGLDASAIAAVTAQVANAIGAGASGEIAAEDILSAAAVLAEVAAETAGSVLGLGGSIEDVKALISIATGTLLEVGESGDLDDIIESARALTAGLDTAKESGGLSLEELSAFTEDIGTVITASVVDANNRAGAEGGDDPDAAQDDTGKAAELDLTQLIKTLQEQIDEGAVPTLEELIGTVTVTDPALVDLVREEIKEVAVQQETSTEELTQEIERLVEDSVIKELERIGLVTEPVVEKVVEPEATDPVAVIDPEVTIRLPIVDPDTVTPIDGINKLPVDDTPTLTLR